MQVGTISLAKAHGNFWLTVFFLLNLGEASDTRFESVQGEFAGVHTLFKYKKIKFWILSEFSHGFECEQVKSLQEQAKILWQ